MNETFEDPSQTSFDQTTKITTILAALDSYEVGQRIRQARVNKGLKQKELIEDQFSKSYISSIEAGRLLPSPRAFEFFAERLGVSITYLQWGSDNPPEDLTAETGGVGRVSLEPHRSPGLRKRLNWELNLTLAQVELERARPEQARDQLLEQGAPTPEVSPSLAVRYYFLLGEVYLRLAELKAALEEFSRALEIAQSLPDREMTARLFNALAQGYQLQGRQTEAVNYRRQALEAIKRGEIKDPAFQAKVYYSLAEELRVLNEQSPALSLYQEAVALTAQLTDRRQLAESYSELGVTYHKQGNLTLARFYADRSLSIYEESNNLHLATSVQASYAQVLIEQQEYAEAEQYLTRALTLAEALNSYEAASTAASSLSLVYLYLKDGPREDEYARLGVELARRSENPVVLGQALARLANLYATRENLEEANRQFTQAVSALEPAGAYPVLANIYFEYGRTLMNLHRDREAAALFEKAYMLQSGYGPRRT